MADSLVGLHDFDNVAVTDLLSLVLDTLVHILVLLGGFCTLLLRLSDWHNIDPERVVGKLQVHLDFLSGDELRFADFLLEQFDLGFA